MTPQPHSIIVKPRGHLQNATQCEWNGMSILYGPLKYLRTKFFSFWGVFGNKKLSHFYAARPSTLAASAWQGCPVAPSDISAVRERNKRQDAGGEDDIDSFEKKNFKILALYYWHNVRKSFKIDQFAQSS